MEPLYTVENHPAGKSDRDFIEKACEKPDINASDLERLLTIYACKKEKTISRWLRKYIKQNDSREVYRLLSANIDRMKDGYSLATYVIQVQEDFKTIGMLEEIKIIFKRLTLTFEEYLDDLETSTDSAIILKNRFDHLHIITRALIICQAYLLDNYQQLDSPTTNTISDCCIRTINVARANVETKNNAGILLVMVNGCDLRDGFTRALDDLCVNASRNQRICITWGVLNYSQKFHVDLGEHVAVIVDFLLDSAVDLDGSNGDVDFQLTLCRSIELISNKMMEKIDTKIFERLLEFAWNCVNHYIDTVRYMAKDIAGNLVKFASSDDQFMDIVLKRILLGTEQQNARYICLSIACKYVNCVDLLRVQPMLLEEVRNGFKNHSISTAAISCYESMLKTYFNQLPTSEWSDLFITPLINQYESDYSVFLRQAIKICPGVGRKILSHSGNASNLLILDSITIVKESGHLEILQVLNDDDQMETWNNVISVDFIRNCMVDGNCEIRISALSLIVETKKITTPYTRIDLDLIEYFIKYNLNAQSPSVRQRIIASFKKHFQRIAEISSILKRNANYQSVELLSKHLGSLRQILFSNLFKFANSNRRNITLELLVALRNCFERFRSEGEKFVEKKFVPMLMHCLEQDGFDKNRQLCLVLLEDLNANDLGLTPHNVQETITNCFKLAVSINPSDSQTAAYLLNAYIYQPITRDFLNKLANNPKPNVNSNVTNRNLNLYLGIQVLLKELNEQLDVARVCLGRAASTKPLHGTLLNIRVLFEKFEDDTLTDQLIDVCLEVSQVVAPVVCGSSPEGFLPMDKGLIDGKVTAQKVLVCAWRTAKEISLLFGVIANKSTTNSSNLTRIGDYFIQMLLETKHRGAFEQTYVGFLALCKCLWRSHDLEMSQLPRKWLVETLETLQTLTSEKSGKFGKLCATRRSAGVPFMIQAIIITESQVFKRSTCFDLTMQTLLDLSEQSDEESGVHSMNILRALFRHNELGEFGVKFVERAIIISVRGFNSKSWAIRNASTLLFSALITRIFGVQRSKDILTTRNKMTFIVFFTRFPRLLPFIINVFQKSHENWDAEDQTTKEFALFPVFLILARLYPGFAHVNDPSILEIIALIDGCDLKMFKTRELAAKAVVSLINPGKYSNRLTCILHYLNVQKRSINYIHGILLQIRLIIANLPENTPIDELVSGLKTLPQSINSCYLLMDEVNKILLKIYERSGIIRDDAKNREIFREFVREVLNDQKEAIVFSGIGLRSYLNGAMDLRIVAAVLDGASVENIAEVLTSGQLDVNRLKIIFYLLNDTPEIIAELEIQINNSYVFDTMDERTRTNLKRHLLNDESLKRQLKNMFENQLDEDHQLLLLLTYGCYVRDKHDPKNQLEHLQNLLAKSSRMFERFNLKNDKIQTSFLFCTCMLLKNFQFDNVPKKLHKRLSKFLMVHASYEMPYVNRLLTARIIAERGDYFFTVFSNDFPFNWLIVLRLMQDTEVTVRREIFKIVRPLPIVSDFAHELIIERLHEELSPFNFSRLQFYVKKFLHSDDEKNGGELEDEELRVFDKGEMNVYCEEKKILNLINSHFITSKLQ